MKDIRKYLCDAASIQHINCAFQKRVFRQPGRGPNPALGKMMCVKLVQIEMRELLFFFSKTFENSNVFLYLIFYYSSPPCLFSPEATKVNLFKHMTSMNLISNRFKTTHLEILSVQYHEV